MTSTAPAAITSHLSNQAHHSSCLNHFVQVKIHVQVTCMLQGELLLLGATSLAQRAAHCSQKA